VTVSVLVRVARKNGLGRIENPLATLCNYVVVQKPRTVLKSVSLICPRANRRRQIHQRVTVGVRQLKSVRDDGDAVKLDSGERLRGSLRDAFARRWEARRRH